MFGGDGCVRGADAGDLRVFRDFTTTRLRRLGNDPADGYSTFRLRRRSRDEARPRALRARSRFRRRTDAGLFCNKDLPVLVSDGRLTLTLGGSGQITHTKVNSITIAPGTMPEHRFTSPAGGEKYCGGGSVPLRWTGATAGALVRLEISRDGANGPWQTLGLMPDDGQENWGASGAISGNVFFRLLDPDNAVLTQALQACEIAEPKIRLVYRTVARSGLQARRGARMFEHLFTGNVRIDLCARGERPWTACCDHAQRRFRGPYRDARRNRLRACTHRRVPLDLPVDQSDAAFETSRLHAARRPLARGFPPSGGTHRPVTRRHGDIYRRNAPGAGPPSSPSSATCCPGLPRHVARWSTTHRRRGA